jgi:hypothetical protein
MDRTIDRSVERLIPAIQMAQHGHENDKRNCHIFLWCFHHDTRWCTELLQHKDTDVEMRDNQAERGWIMATHCSASYHGQEMKTSGGREIADPGRDDGGHLSGKTEP